MKESEIQKDIIDYLKNAGCLVFRMNAGMAKYNVKLAPNGTPDLLAITKKGTLLWLEVKTETGKLNDNQIRMHKLLQERLQVVETVRSVKDIKIILDTIE
jgi:Holliday junction resolvase